MRRSAVDPRNPPISRDRISSPLAPPSTMQRSALNDELRTRRAALERLSGPQGGVFAGELLAGAGDTVDVLRCDWAGLCLRGDCRRILVAAAL